MYLDFVEAINIDELAVQLCKELGLCSARFETLKTREKRIESESESEPISNSPSAGGQDKHHTRTLESQSYLGKVRVKRLAYVGECARRNALTVY